MTTLWDNKASEDMKQVEQRLCYKENFYVLEGSEYIAKQNEIISALSTPIINLWKYTINYGTRRLEKQTTS